MVFEVVHSAQPSVISVLTPCEYSLALPTLLAEENHSWHPGGVRVKALGRDVSGGTLCQLSLLSPQDTGATEQLLGTAAISQISCWDKLFGLWSPVHPHANEITPQDTGTVILSPEQASRVCCVCGKVLACVHSRKKFLFFLEIKQWLLLFPTWQLHSERVEVSLSPGGFLELTTLLGTLCSPGRA